MRWAARYLPNRTFLSRLTIEFYYTVKALRVFESLRLILLHTESRRTALVTQSCRAGDSPRVPIEEAEPPQLRLSRIIHSDPR